MVIRYTFWVVELPYFVIFPFRGLCPYPVNVENFLRDLIQSPPYPGLFPFPGLFTHYFKASICMSIYLFESSNNRKQILSGINYS